MEERLRLELFESKGLLTIDKAPGSNVSFLILTEKGERFVSLLLEADSLIDTGSEVEDGTDPATDA